MGCSPGCLRTVASAIVEAALGDHTLSEAVNPVHPRPADAMDIVDSLQSVIVEAFGRPVKTVPFTEWVSIPKASPRKLL
ncbi:hypothetical protein H0H87_011341 [Tephrocybe sp. NHM501043]|nr:hypothetical protein H0H87_011341 [Tephrocybe sp. NHM501043]